jgi:hypothetical protein
MVGGPERHACKEGGVFFCHGGTEGCVDGRSCAGLERRACAEGGFFYCERGVEGCEDGRA